MHSRNIHPSGITASRNSVKKCKIIVLASDEKPSWVAYSCVATSVLRMHACSCVFKGITLIGSNQNATACSKRKLKTTVATQLKALVQLCAYNKNILRYFEKFDTLVSVQTKEKRKILISFYQNLIMFCIKMLLWRVPKRKLLLRQQPGKHWSLPRIAVHCHKQNYLLES
jgi:hypothetical protein